MGNNFFSIKEKYCNDSSNRSLTKFVESDNIITYRFNLNSTNLAKKWEHRKVEWPLMDSGYNSHCMVRFWWSSTCDAPRQAVGCAGGVKGEGCAVVCSGPLDVAQGQGEWLTTKIQQNKRWRRGAWAGPRRGSQNTDAARTGRESGAARDALKIDARSATGIQHSYVIATATLDEWRHGGPMRPTPVIVIICDLPSGTDIGLFCGLTRNSTSEIRAPLGVEMNSSYGVQ